MATTISRSAIKPGGTATNTGGGPCAPGGAKRASTTRTMSGCINPTMMRYISRLCVSGRRTLAIAREKNPINTGKAQSATAANRRPASPYPCASPRRMTVICATRIEHIMTLNRAIPARPHARWVRVPRCDPCGLHEIEQCPAEEQRTMNVKDRRPMESTAGDGSPIGRREAAECHQHEDAGHPQIEIALAGAQDRVAGDRRLQCARCFHGALPTELSGFALTGSRGSTG